MVVRDYFIFLDDENFSMTVGVPRSFALTTSKKIFDAADPELQKADFVCIDLPTLRRFSARFKDFSIEKSATKWKKKRFFLKILIYCIICMEILDFRKISYIVHLISEWKNICFLKKKTDLKYCSFEKIILKISNDKHAAIVIAVPGAIQNTLAEEPFINPRQLSSLKTFIYLFFAIKI